MSILRQFSEKEQQYHEYQVRQNFLPEQRTIRWEYEQSLEQERMEKEQPLRREQRREKEEAQAEIERLKALLARKNAG